MFRKISYSLCIGMGRYIKMKVFGYNLDYAIVPYENFGVTHKLSFQTKF